MKDDAEPRIGASVAKAIAVKRSEENTRRNLATPDRRNYAAGLLVRQAGGVHEMLGIEKVDHIGIRVSDKSVSIAFYERLGFQTLSDVGFERGHPIIMRHPSGVVINLLGPANTPNDKNILMDVDEKYPGITHVSLRVGSIDAAREFLEKEGIPLSGQFSFRDLQAVFIRDPDRNVIELDAYAADEPETRGGVGSTGYEAHP